MNVSVFLFSNFKEINWLLKKLYMDVFTDANKHQQIDRIIPSQCDPIIDCSTCIIWFNSVTMMVGIDQSKSLM